MKAVLVAAVSGLALASTAAAQALAEPPAGKFILGIWGQSDPGYQSVCLCCRKGLVQQDWVAN